VPMCELSAHSGVRHLTGLLDGLTDPKVMAQAAERKRIIAKIAEQLCIDRRAAAEVLWTFEACTSSEGQVLH
jgi:hypothetical protein